MAVHTCVRYRAIAGRVFSERREAERFAKTLPVGVSGNVVETESRHFVVSIAESGKRSDLAYPVITCRKNKVMAFVQRLA